MAARSKRARVMARSRKLGHCICDPRKPCPCEMFIEQNICTCAGERPAAPAGASEDTQRPALTKLVKNAGCASKIPAAELAAILSKLPTIDDPRLLVGLGTADDAGVIQISPDLCLVQTVDVFAPSVDDPYLFGQIAVCNSLSDVYAMGGKPLSALSVISYPIHTLPPEWMSQMLRGGIDKLTEAGVLLAGGHSINGEEMLFGFAVTGTVAPDAIVTNAGARPGDVLILTKPLGTGILSFAAQMNRADESAIRAMGESMATLNRSAAEIMCEVGAHACTDVTGFGLLGHLYNMVRESGVRAEVYWDCMPLLPSVLECAKESILSGAAERNREFAADAVEPAEAVPEYALDMLYDAQTSGGLLIAVPKNKAEETISQLHAAGCEAAAVMGRILGKCDGGRIMVTEREHAGDACCGASSGKAAQPESSCCNANSPCCEPAPSCCETTSECCAPGSDPVEPGAAKAAFSQFMSQSFAPGALDIVQKEIMTIALSVAVQCEDCLDQHLPKARSMGITEEEIEEAAWMGVAFGGCKAMMFWQEKSQAPTKPSSGNAGCCQD